MCVSPHLVCGAWVGGEYRSIHFRTGALGQGSKTALPICGYFLESVMNDPAFKKYHGHFKKPNDADITANLYNCSSYYGQVRDTVETDTLAIEMEDEILLDEDGNPINMEEDPNNPNQNQNSTANGQQPAQIPKEQPVNFEDL